MLLATVKTDVYQIKPLIDSNWNLTKKIRHIINIDHLTVSKKALDCKQARWLSAARIERKI